MPTTAQLHRMSFLTTSSFHISPTRCFSLTAVIGLLLISCLLSPRLHAETINATATTTIVSPIKKCFYINGIACYTPLSTAGMVGAEYNTQRAATYTNCVYTYVSSAYLGPPTYAYRVYYSRTCPVSSFFPRGLNDSPYQDYSPANYCGVGTTWNGSACVTTTYSCPPTGGWTLAGSSCLRPDCELGTRRVEQTGECVFEKDLGEPNCFDREERPPN